MPFLPPFTGGIDPIEDLVGEGQFRPPPPPPVPSFAPPPPPPPDYASRQAERAAKVKAYSEPAYRPPVEEALPAGDASQPQPLYQPLPRVSPELLTGAAYRVMSAPGSVVAAPIKEGTPLYGAVLSRRFWPDDIFMESEYDRMFGKAYPENWFGATPTPPTMAPTSTKLFHPDIAYAMKPKLQSTRKAQKAIRNLVGGWDGDGGPVAFDPQIILQIAGREEQATLNRMQSALLYVLANRASTPRTLNQIMTSSVFQQSLKRFGALGEDDFEYDNVISEAVSIAMMVTQGDRKSKVFDDDYGRVNDEGVPIYWYPRGYAENPELYEKWIQNATTKELIDGMAALHQWNDGYGLQRASDTLRVRSDYHVYEALQQFRESSRMDAWDFMGSFYNGFTDMLGSLGAMSIAAMVAPVKPIAKATGVLASAGIESITGGKAFSFKDASREAQLEFERTSMDAGDAFARVVEEIPLGVYKWVGDLGPNFMQNILDAMDEFGITDTAYHVKYRFLPDPETGSMAFTEKDRDAYMQRAIEDPWPFVLDNVLLAAIPAVKVYNSAVGVLSGTLGKMKLGLSAEAAQLSYTRKLSAIPEELSGVTPELSKRMLYKATEAYGEAAAGVMGPVQKAKLGWAKKLDSKFAIKSQAHVVGSMDAAVRGLSEASDKLYSSSLGMSTRKIAKLKAERDSAVARLEKAAVEALDVADAGAFDGIWTMPYEKFVQKVADKRVKSQFKGKGRGKMTFTEKELAVTDDVVEAVSTQQVARRLKEFEYWGIPEDQAKFWAKRSAAPTLEEIASSFGEDAVRAVESARALRSVANDVLEFAAMDKVVHAMHEGSAAVAATLSGASRFVRRMALSLGPDDIPGGIATMKKITQGLSPHEASLVLARGDSVVTELMRLGMAPQRAYRTWGLAVNGEGQLAQMFHSTFTAAGAPLSEVERGIAATLASTARRNPRKFLAQTDKVPGEMGPAQALAHVDDTMSALRNSAAEMAQAQGLSTENIDRIVAEALGMPPGFIVRPTESVYEVFERMMPGEGSLLAELFPGISSDGYRAGVMFNMFARPGMKWGRTITGDLKALFPGEFGERVAAESMTVLEESLTSALAATDQLRYAAGKIWVEQGLMPAQSFLELATGYMPRQVRRKTLGKVKADLKAATAAGKQSEFQKVLSETIGYGQPRVAGELESIREMVSGWGGSWLRDMERAFGDVLLEHPTNMAAQMRRRKWFRRPGSIVTEEGSQAVADLYGIDKAGIIMQSERLADMKLFGELVRDMKGLSTTNTRAVSELLTAPSMSVGTQEYLARFGIDHMGLTDNVSRAKAALDVAKQVGVIRKDGVSGEFLRVLEEKHGWRKLDPKQLGKIKVGGAKYGESKGLHQIVRALGRDVFVSPELMDGLRLVARSSGVISGQYSWSARTMQWLKLHQIGLNPAAAGRDLYGNIFVNGPAGGLMPWDVGAYNLGAQVRLVEGSWFARQMKRERVSGFETGPLAEMGYKTALKAKDVNGLLQIFPEMVERTVGYLRGMKADPVRAVRRTAVTPFKYMFNPRDTAAGEFMAAFRSSADSLSRTAMAAKQYCEALGLSPGKLKQSMGNAYKQKYRSARKGGATKQQARAYADSAAVAEEMRQIRTAFEAKYKSVFDEAQYDVAIAGGTADAAHTAFAEEIRNASQRAKDTFVDYTKKSRILDRLSSSWWGAPYATFTAKIFPRLVQFAASNPLQARIALGMYNAANQFLILSEMPDADVEQIMRSSPSHRKIVSLGMSPEFSTPFGNQEMLAGLDIANMMPHPRGAMPLFSSFGLGIGKAMLPSNKFLREMSDVGLMYPSRIGYGKDTTDGLSQLGETAYNALFEMGLPPWGMAPRLGDIPGVQDYMTGSTEEMGPLAASAIRPLAQSVVGHGAGDMGIHEGLPAGSVRGVKGSVLYEKALAGVRMAGFRVVPHGPGAEAFTGPGGPEVKSWLRRYVGGQKGAGPLDRYSDLLSTTSRHLGIPSGEASAEALRLNRLNPGHYAGAVSRARNDAMVGREFASNFTKALGEAVSMLREYMAITILIGVKADEIANLPDELDVEKLLFDKMEAKLQRDTLQKWAREAISTGKQPGDALAFLTEIQGEVDKIGQRLHTRLLDGDLRAKIGGAMPGALSVLEGFDTIQNARAESAETERKRLQTAEKRARAFEPFLDEFDPRMIDPYGPHVSQGALEAKSEKWGEAERAKYRKGRKSRRPNGAKAALQDYNKRMKEAERKAKREPFLTPPPDFGESTYQPWVKNL